MQTKAVNNHHISKCQHLSSRLHIFALCVSVTSNQEKRDVCHLGNGLLQQELQPLKCTVSMLSHPPWMEGRQFCTVKATFGKRGGIG